MNTSLPVLLCRSNAVFWVICQFDKPNGLKKPKLTLVRPCASVHAIRWLTPG